MKMKVKNKGQREEYNEKSQRREKEATDFEREKAMKTW